MNMSKKLRISSNSQDIVLNVEKNETLLNVLRNNNININAPCNGKITCGKCKVKLKSGQIAISESERNLLSQKELNNGYRLACSIKVNKDLEIELLDAGKLQVMTESIIFKNNLDPAVQSINFEASQIRVENDKSYLDLINNDKKFNDIGISLLKKLGNLIASDKVSVLSYFDRIIDLRENFKNLYGIAVDIGTTTVAVYLMNLSNGEEVDVDSFHNPQKKYGADVISRINYTQENNNSVQTLQKLIIDSINHSICKLASNNNIKTDDIYLMTAVGNTTMNHLFLGVNPASLAQAPYRPIFTKTIELAASEIGVNINDNAIIQMPPNLSAYVGSDIIADMLVSDFDSEEWNLLIDIGTNGEIVLGNNQQMFACSAAAGPAFEGAKITFGMGGVSGAISEFKITDENLFHYETIDSKDPIGICGSGLIDIVVEMAENKIIESTGSFNEMENGILENKITKYKNMKALKISESKENEEGNSVFLTQKDVREVQLAKGAIAAGINILLKEAGIKYKDLNNIYLAGGFGSFINSKNACKIGLLPNNMEDKIIKIGNGAGLGAKTYMMDKKQKEKAENLAKKTEYIELSLRQDFQEEFVNSMEF